MQKRFAQRRCRRCRGAVPRSSASLQHGPAAAIAQRQADQGGAFARRTNFSTSSTVVHCSSTSRQRNSQGTPWGLSSWRVPGREDLVDRQAPVRRCSCLKCSRKCPGSRSRRRHVFPWAGAPMTRPYRCRRPAVGKSRFRPNKGPPVRSAALRPGARSSRGPLAGRPTCWPRAQSRSIASPSA